MPFTQSFFLLLDIAPLSWTGLFLVPVLVVALVVLVAVVLIQTIRERKRERKNAAHETKRTQAEHAPDKAEEDGEA